MGETQFMGSFEKCVEMGETKFLLFISPFEKCLEMTEMQFLLFIVTDLHNWNKQNIGMIQKCDTRRAPNDLLDV